MTFIALLLNIILCYIFFRRDHIREEQSLRICQGHPNIVKLQEVFQDAVSALCKVLQSRILILYNLLEALPMYKEFVIIMYSPSLYDWRVGLSLLFFLEMDNFLGPWLIAYSAMLIQCFSMFHFLSGCLWGQHAIQKWEANSFYVKKKRQNGGQNFLKTLHVPFPLQWGLFLLEGDRSFLVIWQTELKVDLEWTQHYSLELLPLYLCPMIMTI